MEPSVLQEFPIFRGSTPERMAAVAKCCTVQTFGAGDEVFEQADTAETFYGVIQGEVDLFLVVSDKVMTSEIAYEEALTVRHEIREKPIVVETVEDGGVFGWASIIDPPGRRTVRARCMKNTRLFSVPAADLLALFEADPALGYTFMRRLGGVIAQRLQHRTIKLIDAWTEAFDNHRV